MSKSTKIIAGLGVVAGLSVAAMPAFTFATGPAISDNVDLYAIVDPAIAMTISGNNDDGSIYNPDVSPATTWADAHGATAGSNPAASTVDGYLGSNDNTLISSSATRIAPNGLVNGNETNNFASLITVYTNNTGGYNLTVKANTSANMVGVGSSSNTIVPVATEGTDAGKIMAGSSLWGYKKGTYHAATTNPETAAYWDGFSTDGTGYSAMTTSDSSALTTTATPTSGGDQTKIYYGVSAAADQATDVYHVSLTYTATAN